MGLWSTIFSAPGTVNKVTDAIINTGDALVFTEEEQSVANLKKLDWLLKFHEASKGSNLARRLLAIMMVGVFLALVVLAALLILMGFEGQYAAILELIDKTLVVPVGMIIVWYFTNGIVRDFKK